MFRIKLIFFLLLLSISSLAHDGKLIFQQSTRAEMEMKREQLLESMEDVKEIEEKEQYEKEEEPEKKEQTVYITKSGKKYHLESCRYVKKGAKAISKDDAIDKGYEACKVCKP